MTKPISQFFVDLGFKLKNSRWSWGAKNADGNALLLRCWADEYSFKDKTVTVLHEAERYLATDSYGLDERIVQLKELWAGGISAYVVIARAKNAAADPREIKDYREDAVFGVKRLLLRDNGNIDAEVNELVPVAKLHQHLTTNHIEAAIGVFPIEDAHRSGISTDSYKQKIPAIRDWLIKASQTKATVTYSEVMSHFGLTFYPLVGAMSLLGHSCRNAGEPIITSLIVDKNTGRCSQGIFDEFHIDDDALERQRCYNYWGNAPVQPLLEILPVSASKASTTVDSQHDINQREARFAQVEVRTQQAAFRLAVFRACHGRCVISGCTVPEALEAAHLIDRNWRQGQNQAIDGILLRRDLHTLYDRGLLRITKSGIVECDERVSGDYGELVGLQAYSWQGNSPIFSSEQQ